MSDSSTAINANQSVPKPFKRNGVTYRPVAVAMYGDERHLVPLRQVIDPHSGTYWGGHTLLWAAENGRSNDV